MFRSKTELFELTRARWPDRIKIFIVQNDLGTQFITEPCLSEIYKSIEESLDKNDHWNQIAAWSFNQALDKLSRNKFQRADYILRPSDVSLDSFNTMMKRNLSDESWSVEREIFANLP